MSTVLALGLDAADPALLEQWMGAGHLPNLARLRAAGAYGRIESPALYRTETAWSTLLSGVPASESGEWGHLTFDPGDYQTREKPHYDFHGVPPFYARLPGRRVAIFDVPLVAPLPDVDGVQLCGWGTETNQCLRRSAPAGSMDALLARHGPHPLFAEASAGETVLSYRIPDAYDPEALITLGERLEAAADTRAEIIVELLAKGRWDLLLAVFSETHTASHLLWHLSQAHPLGDALGRPARDPLRAVFEAVDRALGKVLAQVSEDTTVVVFSGYGLAANALDLPSMVFLPEWLARRAGEEPLLGAEARSCSASSAGAERAAHGGYWPARIAALATEAGRRRLALPDFAVPDPADPLRWLPGSWYRPLWREHEAFALPTYADGLVRLNVIGREGRGRIPPAAYGPTLEGIAEDLAALRCGHCGRPLVRETRRTRRDPFDDPATAPPADLAVLWEEHVTDRVVSPVSGAIGPLPYFRSGGHVARGFALIRHPTLMPGSDLPAGHTTDLSATLAALAAGRPGGAPLLRGGS